MRLQAKFFAFVAPVLLATAWLPLTLRHFQLEFRPVSPQLSSPAVLITVGLLVTAIVAVYFAAAFLVCRPIRNMAAELANRNADLAAAESKYRSIFESASEGIFQTSPDGKILVANPAIVRLLGYETEEELLRSVTDVATQVYANPDVRRAYLARVLAEGQVENFEVQFKRRDGSLVWVSMTAGVIRDPQGRPLRFEGMVRDITEQKRSVELDQDRRILLEMIARNEPVTQTLQSVCQAVERQCDDIRGVVLLHDGKRRQVGAAPQFSPLFVLALDELMNLDGDIPPSTEPDEFGDGDSFALDLLSPQWAAVYTAACDEGLVGGRVIPIVSGHGKPLGELLLLLRKPYCLNRKNLRSMQSLAGLAGLAIEHHQLTHRLEYDAVHDPLTGLPNRAQLETQLPRWVGAAARHHRSLAVLMIDLDGFKNVNDTLGHSTGDALLRQVATRLSNAIRDSDVLVRMGGDEFNLVATEIASPEDAQIVADRLIQAFSGPFAVDGRELFVTASVGVAVFPTDGEDAQTLQRSADAAMYAAKASGRNRALRFDPQMIAAAADRLELEGQLRRAITNGELLLEYQPQVNPQETIVGVEALLRWEHPRLGRISPMRFIPLAEQCGLIVPVGIWVLREACWQARAWQDSGCRPVSVAVNVSALQFQQAEFLEVVQTALTDTGLDPQYLELELTESLLMANTADAVEKVSALRAMGVAVAIDDFGTGYSSLAYLRRLPIDRLKIDQSFVKELGEGPKINTEEGRTAIITAIASLAVSLDKGMVAEGVETPAQRDYLIQIGCDTLQGYLFGKPMAADKIESRLRYGPAQRDVCTVAA